MTCKDEHTKYQSSKRPQQEIMALIESNEHCQALLFTPPCTHTSEKYYPLKVCSDLSRCVNKRSSCLLDVTTVGRLEHLEKRNYSKIKSTCCSIVCRKIQFTRDLAVIQP
jgi:hypothetical protein